MNNSGVISEGHWAMPIPLGLICIDFSRIVPLRRYIAARVTGLGLPLYEILDAAE